MSFYDSLHLNIRKSIEEAYYKVYNTRNTNNLFIRLWFVFLCKIDLITASHINTDNDFPTFYYLSEYYHKYGIKPFKALQTCLNGIKYKFKDVETLYLQLEFLIKYFRKFPQLQFYYDYENDCLYDGNTGEVIENIFDYLKSRKKVNENETR